MRAKTTPLHAFPDAKQARRRPIRAEAHPGGRFPGVMLPPTWFELTKGTRRLPSALPHPSDRKSVVEGVATMSLALRELALAAFEAGEHPCLVGGDHALAMGSIAAATTWHSRVAVIWVDAHADFNTPESSPSGNPHGMPLAVACGLGHPRFTQLYTHHVHPGDVCLIAARDVDEGEQELLRQQGIWQVPVAQLRELGLPGLVAQLEARFAGVPVHLSFDFDAIDAMSFPATGTPVPHGLKVEEAEAFLKALAASSLEVTSSDWVEFDPRPAEAAACAEVARRMFKAFHGRAALA